MLGMLAVKVDAARNLSEFSVGGAQKLMHRNPIVERA